MTDSNDLFFKNYDDIDFSAPGKVLFVFQVAAEKIDRRYIEELSRDNVICVARFLPGAVGLQGDCDGRFFALNGAVHWYFEDSKKRFSVFDNSVRDVVRDLLKGYPKLAHQHEAMSVLLLDKLHMDHYCLAILDAQLGPDVRDVVVVSNNGAFDAAVSDLIIGKGLDIPVCSPLKGASPAYVQKPGKKGILRLLYQLWKDFRHRDVKPRDVPVTGKSPVILPSPSKNPFYLEALHQAALAVLETRPAIVVFFGGAWDGTEKVRESLREKAARTGHACTVIYIVQVLREVLFSPKTQKALLKIMRKARELERPGAYPGLDLTDIYKRYAVAHTTLGMVRAFLGAVYWLDEVLSRCRPAYGLVFGARIYYGVAFDALMRRRSVPTVDVHVLTQADSARQFQTHTNYHAVIDSEQEDFLARSWNLDRQNVVRIGYLLKTAVVSSAPSVPVAHNDDKRVIMVATQTGVFKHNLELLMAVIEAAEKFNDCEIVLKLHPREPEDFRESYQYHLDRHGTIIPVRILPPDACKESVLQSAFLVVTRTSNVGVEASGYGIPVVRYVANDRFLPDAFLKLPYALNALTREELLAHITDVLSEGPALESLRRRQEDYRTKNPAIYKADGAVRLVDFMEGKAGAVPDVSGTGGWDFPRYLKRAIFGR